MRDGPPRDPNYILSQDQFRATMADYDRRRQAGEQLLGLKAERETNYLLDNLGWALVSVGCWIAVWGLLLIGAKRKLR